MIGQVLVDGRPGWRCWACGSEWQYPPHQDAAEYADAEREWMQAHKGCGESVTDRYELHEGDALTVLRGMASESVHMCMTSPPYWALRDYGTATWEGGDPSCDHKANVAPRSSRPLGAFHGGNDEYVMTPYRDICGKCGARRIDQGIGLEKSPEEWCAKLVEVFREVRRVLRRDGTLWLNVGFSYDGRGNLIDQPTMLRDALVADGWYCKAPIVWAKPNPMPGSQDKRPTVAHEMVWLLARDKGTGYYYDGDAVREPSDQPTRFRADMIGGLSGPNGIRHGNGGIYNGGQSRSLRSVWTIPTEPSPLPHFASFPQALVKPCVLAGTSQRGCCPQCGAGWVRVVERIVGRSHDCPKTEASAGARGGRGITSTIGQSGSGRTDGCSVTLGWRPSCSCGCPDTVPAVVLDPFAGTGTTGLVALRYGRRFVGIELSPEYVALARARLDEAAAQPRLELDAPAPAVATQLTMMEDPGNGAQEVSRTRLPDLRG